MEYGGGFFSSAFQKFCQTLIVFDNLTSVNFSSNNCNENVSEMIEIDYNGKK